MSTKILSNEETSFLAKGLKFVPTPKVNEQTPRRELMQDCQEFETTMRLLYLFEDKKDKPHPYYVKSNLKPPVTQSVALKSFLDEVKLQISEALITKPKGQLK